MEKKITIGLFIDTYFPTIDGVVMVVHNYATRLSKVANVIVFCPTIDKEFDDSNFNYKIVRSKSIKVSFMDYKVPTPNLDKKFCHLVENSKLDIVHIHSFFAIGKIGIKYAKKHNVPLIGTIHSQYQQDIYEKTRIKWITNSYVKRLVRLMEEPDQLFAVNQGLANIYYSYGLKTNVSILSNGTDFTFLKDYNEIELLKDKYRITNEKILLFVGRIEKIKNIPFIIEVLKELKKNNYKFKMFFIGEGIYKKELRRKIIEFNLENNVIILGKISNRDELCKYYHMADLFIFPSTYDSSSLVQVEAASQKVPTIFAEGSITSSNIVNNVNGYTEKLDSKIFAERIIGIFEDRETYNKVCENAYKDIYINWDDLVKDVHKYYFKMIKDYSSEVE